MSKPLQTLSLSEPCSHSLWSPAHVRKHQSRPLHSALISLDCCNVTCTQHALQNHVCSVNDIEEKYYADGEDAYDMRKPFKDVRSKPAIVPKGSRHSQAEDATRQSSQLRVDQAPTSASADSSGTEPAAETTVDNSDTQSSNGEVKSSADTTSGSEGKGAQPKTKAAKNKKR